MKKLLFVAITILLVVACKQNTPDTTTQISKETPTDFTSLEMLLPQIMCYLKMIWPQAIKILHLEIL